VLIVLSSGTGERLKLIGDTIPRDQTRVFSRPYIDQSMAGVKRLISSEKHI
jgi:dTDP-glucose pyrophosphorylase